MKRSRKSQTTPFKPYVLAFLLLSGLALWLQKVPLESSWQHAGMTDFSLGMVLLVAFVTGQTAKAIGLPMISGYIFAGIVAGPYVSGFLSAGMVDDLHLIDDLALSFIALTAGGSLHLDFLKKRVKAIALNVAAQTLAVFALVASFVYALAEQFAFTKNLSPVEVATLAILLGVVCIARSPSSTIAVISECGARGVFTETVLGVTVVIDVIIIILFTLALTVCEMLQSTIAAMDHTVFAALTAEIVASIVVGAIAGKGIALYIERIGHDLALFLLFFGFGVTRLSLWLNQFMQAQFQVALHLEPLLICMSAGLTVQNFSTTGGAFMESLHRLSPPIYVLFFSLAGSSLNLAALGQTWLLALCLATVRAAALFVGAWLAGTASRDRPLHNRLAWMGYLAQAGVSLGLAQLAAREFSVIGDYFCTIVLAVITLNQVLGPITLRCALNLTGEAPPGQRPA
ncbi:cation:proton antiporter [Desulfoferrobacter suflitae]|uniref:cation:proton antiporter n=1 Tax=Desulfoferrobacter suflitae TaxID=2865782 RepID=UPI002164BB43|nr:cation:proton antiporter [Desulfoferrobacter suflitae]MCK8603158.1 cation:proton antiporter [Desulfoferrobacter suflitae]